MKTTMNLSKKSILNIDKIQELTEASNRTTAVAIGLNITKEILTQVHNGNKIIIRDNDGNEQEMKLLY